MSRRQWAFLTLWAAAALLFPGVLVWQAPWVRGAPGAAASQELTPALRSLRAAQYDPRFGLEYWMELYRREGRGGEMAKAFRYCRDVDPEARPNCRTLRVLDGASRVPGFLEEVRGR